VLFVDGLNAAKIEEDDLAIRTEEVVAGVGIGVEERAAEDAFEDEAPEGFAPGDAARLVGGDRLVERSAMTSGMRMRGSPA
jgi:hypothetical protein